MSQTLGSLLAPKELELRLKKIRLLILDVDGVLTDGRIFWISNQGWTRQFHIQDGYGIKLLMKSGIQVAVISGGDSEDVRKRIQHLNIPYSYLGSEDKIKGLEKLIETTQLKEDQMAFIGDELFDLPVLKRVGLSATVPDAVSAVLNSVHYITQRPGGAGAVREITDMIRQSQGLS